MWRETNLKCSNPNISSTSQHSLCDYFLQKSDECTFEDVVWSCTLFVKVTKRLRDFIGFNALKTARQLSAVLKWLSLRKMRLFYRIRTFTWTCSKVCVCVGPLRPCWWGADYRDTTHAAWPRAICPHGTEKSTAPQADRTSQQHRSMWGYIFQPKRRLRRFMI